LACFSEKQQSALRDGWCEKFDVANVDQEFDIAEKASVGSREHTAYAEDLDFSQSSSSACKQQQLSPFRITAFLSLPRSHAIAVADLTMLMQES